MLDLYVVVREILPSGVLIHNMVAHCCVRISQDFFVDEHWEKLPPSWRRCLETAEGEQLSSLVSGCGSVLAPLSLLALLQLARSAALPREPRPTPRSACPTRHLHNLFTKHVKLKKRHEISVMSELVYKVCMHYAWPVW